jgi:hypothetical protein
MTAPATPAEKHTSDAHTTTAPTVAKNTQQIVSYAT